jgi:molybdopterin/thiamine biosynthesis adenylyltransferase/proteasome lid subunit RPN8/RPN11
MNELVISESMLRDLRGALLVKEKESAAILLAEEVEGSKGKKRLLVREACIPTVADYAERTSIAAVLSPGFVAKVGGEARGTGSSLIFAHTHPAGPLEFSHTDRAGEQRLLPFLARRLPGRLHAALLLTPTGNLARSVGDGKEMAVIEVGQRRVCHAPGQGQTLVDERFDRQIRAFGAEGQAAIGQLTIGIVGLGGTGSVVAQQLAYLGVQSFILVDPDIVEATNLNRVVGAKPQDIGRPKVEVAKDHILSIAPRVHVEVMQDSILHDACSRRLAHATDWLWGCTDSHGSRAVINKIAYQYLIPSIDMGVAIVAGAQGITHVTGRVQQLSPGRPCLLCHGLLDGEAVRRDFMSEADLAKDPYFLGAGVPQPAVISLNSTVASLGVTMFLSSVAGVPGGARHQMVNAITGQTRAIVAEPQLDCLVCSISNACARGDSWPLPTKKA